jgi:hypothetical protein
MSSGRISDSPKWHSIWVSSFVPNTCEKLEQKCCLGTYSWLLPFAKATRGQIDSLFLQRFSSQDMRPVEALLTTWHPSVRSLFIYL